MAKMWNTNGVPGLIQQSVSKVTQTTVRLWHAEQAGLKPEDNLNYVVQCLDHGQYAGFKGQRPARNAIPNPTLWCPYCKDPEAMAADPGKAMEIIIGTLPVEAKYSGEWSFVAPQGGPQAAPEPEPEDSWTPAAEVVHEALHGLAVSTPGPSSVLNTEDTPKALLRVEATEGPDPRLEQPLRDAMKCDACGSLHRKVWSITDPRYTHYLNNMRITGPRAGYFCSLSCLKTFELGSPRAKGPAGWQAAQAGGA